MAGAPWVGDHYHVPIRVRTLVLRNGSDILGPALFIRQWRAQIWLLCPPQGWLLGSGLGPSFPRRMGNHTVPGPRLPHLGCCHVSGISVWVQAVSYLPSWFMGRRPEYTDPKVVAQGEGREGKT